MDEVSNYTIQGALPVDDAEQYHISIWSVVESFNKFLKAYDPLQFPSADAQSTYGSSALSDYSSYTTISTTSFYSPSSIVPIPANDYSAPSATSTYSPPSHITPSYNIYENPIGGGAPAYNPSPIELGLASPYHHNDPVQSNINQFSYNTNTNMEMKSPLMSSYPSSMYGSRSDPSSATYDITQDPNSLAYNPYHASDSPWYIQPDFSSPLDSKKEGPGYVMQEPAELVKISPLNIPDINVDATKMGSSSRPNFQSTFEHRHFHAQPEHAQFAQQQQSYARPASHSSNSEIRGSLEYRKLAPEEYYNTNYKHHPDPILVQEKREEIREQLGVPPRVFSAQGYGFATANRPIYREDRAYTPAWQDPFWLEEFFYKTYEQVSMQTEAAPKQAPDAQPQQNTLPPETDECIGLEGELAKIPPTLKESEGLAHGGHAYKMHVEPLEESFEDRFIRQPKREKLSSFFNEKTAEMAYQMLLRDLRQGICKWLKGNEEVKEFIVHSPLNALGEGLRKGETGRHFVYKARFKLIKTSNGPRVITAYPDVEAL